MPEAEQRVGVVPAWTRAKVTQRLIPDKVVGCLVSIRAHEMSDEINGSTTKQIKKVMATKIDENLQNPAFAECRPLRYGSKIHISLTKPSAYRVLTQLLKAPLCRSLKVIPPTPAQIPFKVVFSNYFISLDSPSRSSPFKLLPISLDSPSQSSLFKLPKISVTHPPPWATHFPSETSKWYHQTALPCLRSHQSVYVRINPFTSHQFIYVRMNPFTSHQSIYVASIHLGSHRLDEIFVCVFWGIRA